MSQSITLPSNITFSKHGLIIHSRLSLADYKATLEFVKNAREATTYYLADLIKYGCETFGEENTSIALEQSNFAFATINEATKVAQSVSIVTREKYALTSEHAFVLSKIADEKKREHWAEQTYTHGLTAQELKQSISTGEIIRKEKISEKTGHGSGLPLLTSVIFHWNRWVNTETEDKILNLPEPQLQKIIATLMPILELAAKIEQKICPTK